MKQVKTPTPQIVAARISQSSTPNVFNITARTYNLAVITTTAAPQKTPLTARIEGAFVDRSTGPVGIVDAVGSISRIESLSSLSSNKLVELCRSAPVETAKSNDHLSQVAAWFAECVLWGNPFIYYTYTRMEAT